MLVIEEFTFYSCDNDTDILCASYVCILYYKYNLYTIYNYSIAHCRAQILILSYHTSECIYVYIYVDLNAQDRS